MVVVRAWLPLAFHGRGWYCSQKTCMEQWMPLLSFLRVSLWCWSGCPPGVTSSSWLWLSHCCSSFLPSSRYSGNNGASSKLFRRFPLTQDTSISSWGMHQSKIFLFILHDNFMGSLSWNSMIVLAKSLHCLPGLTAKFIAWSFQFWAA